MSEIMTFPETVEEFMEQYKIVDTEKVYTSGMELVPIFRMKQWFEHLPAAQNEMTVEQPMSAREYVREFLRLQNKRKTNSTLDDMLAFLDWEDAMAAGDEDDAVSIVERWAREHPERSEE